MSLTSFLNHKDVHKRFTKEFICRDFYAERELRSPPLTKNYSTVGQAFDYLLRFFLQTLNPQHTKVRRWAAEGVLEPFLGDKIIWTEREPPAFLKRADNKQLKKAYLIIQQVKELHAQYLSSGKLTDELLKSCLLLAQIDAKYRTGMFPDNFGTTDTGDIQDLKNLIKLVNPNIFKTRTVCILNPTFGSASELVGGADGDLLLDTTLLDIKTTQHKVKREWFNQIVGYYILSLIGGIDMAPKNLKVRSIGIYFSRQGLLYKVPADEIAKNCDLKRFISWFKKRTKQESKQKYIIRPPFEPLFPERWKKIKDHWVLRKEFRN